MWVVLGGSQWEGGCGRVGKGGRGSSKCGRGDVGRRGCRAFTSSCMCTAAQTPIKGASTRTIARSAAQSYEQEQLSSAFTYPREGSVRGQAKKIKPSNRKAACSSTSQHRWHPAFAPESLQAVSLQGQKEARKRRKEAVMKERYCASRAASESVCEQRHIRIRLEIKVEGSGSAMYACMHVCVCISVCMYLCVYEFMFFFI